MREREMRRRLERLERLPQPQPPPSPLEHIGNLALKQMSDEDLKVMIKMTVDRDSGANRSLLPTEVAALERQDAALETEAQRMGFKSFADAKRRGAGR